MSENKHTPEPMYEEIWLQCPNLDSMSEWYGEVTWCQDQQNDDDTKYVRADLFASIEKQRDELLEVLLTAAETFASYAEIHAAKTPPDIVKAEFNRDRAQMCFAAIASVKGEQ